MRIIRFEPLERRELLAGDVAVAVVGSAIEIQGDNMDNTVQVTDDGANLVFEGLKDTTINGVSSETIPKAGIDQLMAELGTGGDRLTLRGVDIPNVDVSVDLGSGGATAGVRGADSFFLGVFGDTESHVADVTVLGHNQRQIVLIAGATIDGSVFADLGPGRDVFGIVGSGRGANVVNGDLTVLTRSGGDEVTLFGSLINGDISVDMAENGISTDDRQVDRFRLVGMTVNGNVDVLLAEGKDEAVFRVSVIVGTLSVDGGEGSKDSLLIEDVLAASIVHVGFEDVTIL